MKSVAWAIAGALASLQGCTSPWAAETLDGALSNLPMSLARSDVANHLDDIDYIRRFLGPTAKWTAREIDTPSGKEFLGWYASRAHDVPPFVGTSVSYTSYTEAHRKRMNDGQIAILDVDGLEKTKCITRTNAWVEANWSSLRVPSIDPYDDVFRWRRQSDRDIILVVQSMTLNQQCLSAVALSLKLTHY